jgi:hypothetical protein
MFYPIFMLSVKFYTKKLIKNFENYYQAQWGHSCHQVQSNFHIIEVPLLFSLEVLLLKRHWELENLIEHFTLLPNELAMLGNKTGSMQLDTMSGTWHFLQDFSYIVYESIELISYMKKEKLMRLIKKIAN